MRKKTKRQMDIKYKKRGYIMAKFYKFRYTYNNEYQNNENVNQLRKWIKDSFEDGGVCGLVISKALHYVYGVEHLNKFGEPTKIHAHIHFTSESKIESIRKSLQRWFKDDEEVRKGTELYSLVEEKDVIEVERFFRYPLKQVNFHITDENNTDRFGYFIGDECNIEQMRLLAHEEWKKGVEVHLKNRERLCSKDTTYDKLAKYLNEKNCESFKQAIKMIVEFYAQEGMAMNINTMGGYAVTYSVKAGFLSPDYVASKIEKLCSND